jgi:hypothetical protein
MVCPLIQSTRDVKARALFFSSLEEAAQMAPASESYIEAEQCVLVWVLLLLSRKISHFLSSMTAA